MRPFSVLAFCLSLLSVPCLSSQYEFLSPFHPAFTAELSPELTFNWQVDYEAESITAEVEFRPLEETSENGNALLFLV